MAPPRAARVGSIEPKFFEKITDGYKQENCFATFQFGKVYRGVGEDSDVIVKVFEKVDSYEVRPGDHHGRVKDEDCLFNDDYITSHPNIVKVEGLSYSTDNPMVAYSIDPLDTVHNLIDKDSFSWLHRIKVAHGFASLVAYMHAYRPIPYIIRNISAAHILLDQEYNPKLYDFSMISGGIMPDKREISNQYVHGCHGYIDPDHIRNGKWSGKCDVFAYGVILLSLLSKKVVEDKDKRENPEPFLFEWAYNKYQKEKCNQKFKGCQFSLVHQSLKEEVFFSANDGVALTKLAIQCLDKDPLKRPTMKQVVGRLQKLSIIQNYASRCGFEKVQSTSDFKLSGIGKMIAKRLVKNLDRTLIENGIGVLMSRTLKFYSKIDLNMPKTLAKRHMKMFESTLTKYESNVRAPVIFSYEDLKKITDDFSEENYIHFHQFGKLYHGKIMSRAVTVKTWEDNGFYRLHEGDNEIRIRDELVLLQCPKFTSHPHIVKMIGYCYEDERLGVVYDLESLDTLEKLIEDDKFSWCQRIEFSLKLAGILKFLQTSNPPYDPYVLRNLVPCNILVDKDYNPKLFNFGMLSGGILQDREHTLARHCHNWLYYIDPYTNCYDYYMEPSDIYSLGMVLMNLISKKLDMDELGYGDHQWAYNMYEQAASKGRLGLKHFSLADKSFEAESDLVLIQGQRFSKLVMQCIDRNWKERVTIDVVVKSLEKIISN